MKGLLPRTLPETAIFRVAGSIAPENLLVGELRATVKPVRTSLWGNWVGDTSGQFTRTTSLLLHGIGNMAEWVGEREVLNV